MLRPLRGRDADSIARDAASAAMNGIARSRERKPAQLECGRNADARSWPFHGACIPRSGS
jgi:hypothetical protein